MENLTTVRYKERHSLLIRLNHSNVARERVCCWLTPIHEFSTLSFLPNQHFKISTDLYSYVCKLPISDHVMLSKEFFSVYQKLFSYFHEDNPNCNNVVRIEKRKLKKAKRNCLFIIPDRTYICKACEFITTYVYIARVIR